MLRQGFRREAYDVIIVGARCAGAATALLLARAGAKVLVVDRGAHGADTLSTHALMRPAVTQLARWGVLPAVVAAGTPAVTRAMFYYGGEAVAIDIKPGDGVEALYAPRRSVLDRILVDAAATAGAEVHFGMAFEAMEADGTGRVCGARLRDRSGGHVVAGADLVIGADGLGSSVAKQVGAAVYRQAAHRTGVVYGYFAGIENVGYRWYYGPGISVGAIPTNDGLHCVFVCVPPDQFKSGFDDGFGELLRLIVTVDVTLAREMAAAGPQDKLRRFGGVRGYLRQSHGPGWALVGDAGYFKDPITAHGISDALLDAERLAAAVPMGDGAVAAYQAERDRLARPLLAVTDAIAGLDWDLDAVKDLHGVLNACMKAELANPPGAVAAVGQVA